MRNKSFTRTSGKKYESMMSRCYRKKDISYKYHGGRGIKVCSAWIRDINAFRTWVITELERIQVTLDEFVNHSKLITLDRIDTNGHYGPHNCRLTSAQVQGRNKKNRKKRFYESAEGEKIYV